MMGETISRFSTRALLRTMTFGRLIFCGILTICGVVVAAHLFFFVLHAAQMLRYPYPLDYGEGPLLAQVEQLLAGMPLWRLYSNPGLAPYAVVNYPPLYHQLVALFSLLTGDALSAGRLVSLIATGAATLALWYLCPLQTTQHHQTRDWQCLAVRLLSISAFIALPIVREWSVVMRVDMLGLCLGLWGLVLLQHTTVKRRVFLAALLLTLSLFVKPSLIAAPAAGVLWLLFRDWRRGILLCLLVAICSMAPFLLLEIASGGWFATHTLTANANPWEYQLAHRFWYDQMMILWPLPAAGIAGFLSLRLAPPQGSSNSDLAKASDHLRRVGLLPLYYTLFGALVALGVGKVGAYANYFLEFYAGLIWLAASAACTCTALNQEQIPRRGAEQTTSLRQSALLVYRALSPTLILLLVIGSLLRYYPIWSPNHLKLAGIIEQHNPPRLVFGRYSVWKDLRRERAILTTLAAINTALVQEVRSADAPIFTDIPGIAAQAKQLSRLQVFEHRQLLDSGLWDQRPLLRDLANGAVPLVVLDYLGNWLTPEMVALIRHRYAKEGSRGTYELYRPVAPGPRMLADLHFPNGLHLIGYHLAPSPGRSAYHPGEVIVLTLEWTATPSENDQANPNVIEVVAELRDQEGAIVWETSRPLVYGALSPSNWQGHTIQHMHPLVLPDELPPMRYQLAIRLRSSEQEGIPAQQLTLITVEEQGGMRLGERGYYVPEVLLDAWERNGGYDGPGDPIMPAVPLQGVTLQCYVRMCLRYDGKQAERLPLGELVSVRDVGLPAANSTVNNASHTAPTGHRIQGLFLEYWRANGGSAVLGHPITGELIRGDSIVQYTQYARLERPLGKNNIQLGRLGEELLHLPGGETYPWP